MEDFEKSAGELSNEVAKISGEYREVLDEFRDAKKSKADARAEYSTCVGEGDEAGMKSALRKIRAANEKVESLPSLRENFYAKISQLEDRYHNLMEFAKQNVQEFEDGLGRQEKAVAEAKEKYKRVHGILSEINGLRNVIVKSGDVTSSSEENGEI